MFPAHWIASKFTISSATTLSTSHIYIAPETRNIIKHTEIWRLFAHMKRIMVGSLTILGGMGSQGIRPDATTQHSPRGRWPVCRHPQTVVEPYSGPDRTWMPHHQSPGLQRILQESLNGRPSSSRGWSGQCPSHLWEGYEAQQSECLFLNGHSEAKSTPPTSL